ncbi:SEA (Seh1-associated) complex subunit, partial [Coemansia sp. RSA 1933]
ITGFTWFDENLVWSVGRDSNIIQCDMESDSIYTSGLLGNTVADFSLSSYIAVATGSSTYRHGGCFTPAQPLYPHGPSLGLVQHPSSNAGSYGNHSDRSAAASGGPASSGKSAGSAGDGINMAMFQACLPESYVDEHKLDPSIEVKALAISELAKRYRYDPDYFSECCADNANAASSVGLADVSGFWQLLSVAFGDALPLEAERKAEKSRASKSAARAEKRRLKRKQRAAAAAASADQVVEATAANVSTKEGGGDATSLRTGANSTTTSRSSSGMFASKSVIDVLPEGHSSDDEPYSKFVALESMVSMSQPISSTSTTQLRQQHTFGTPVLPSDRAAAADNITNALQKSDATRQGQGLSMSVRGLGLGAKLDRTRMSMSHTNLQQAALSSRRNGRIPSPFSRTTEHSLSGSSGAFASEPTTPLQKISHQTFHDSHTLQLEPSLMSALRVTGPGGYLKGSIGNTPKNKEAASTHESTRKLALQNAASSTMTAEQTNDDNAGLGIIEKRNGASTNNRASATTGMLVESKLQISTQKRTTKTELRMAVESCQYYADIGDVQTAVTAALLLRNFIKLPNWKVAEAWFWAYVEQLDSYKEYALATEILLASPFESVREPILEYNTITMRCSQCGAQLALLPDVGMSHCTECQRKSNSCVVCQEPVASRFIWCQGCGHGGHADHMTEWFDEMRQSSCPSGCGHMCQLLFSASAQS